MRLTKYLLPLLLVLTFSLLAGCTSKDEEKEKTSANQTDEKMITIGWPLDVGPLNPHTYLPNQMTAQAMVYESLVEYNDDGLECVELEWAMAQCYPSQLSWGTAATNEHR